MFLDAEIAFKKIFLSKFFFLEIILYQLMNIFYFLQNYSS